MALGANGQETAIIDPFDIPGVGSRHEFGKGYTRRVDESAAGPWLQVLGGRAFDLCDPKPEQVDFRIIAMVLSRVPRFGGHTEKGVLSVAQHCLEGAAAIRRDGHGDDAADAFLIHDAHEAYIGDIATPVADALRHIAKEVVGREDSWAITHAIRSLKSRLDSAIYTAAGLPWPLDPTTRAIVHEYDIRMCRTERDERLAEPPQAWCDAVERAEPVTGCDLYPWSEGTVFACYMNALNYMLTVRSVADRVRG